MYVLFCHFCGNYAKTLSPDTYYTRSNYFRQIHRHAVVFLYSWGKKGAGMNFRNFYNVEYVKETKSSYVHDFHTLMIDL